MSLNKDLLGNTSDMVDTLTRKDIFGNKIIKALDPREPGLIIKTDGTPENTKVYTPKGELLDRVTNLQLNMDAEYPQFSSVTLSILGVKVEPVA